MVGVCLSATRGIRISRLGRRDSESRQGQLSGSPVASPLPAGKSPARAPVCQVSGGEEEEHGMHVGV